VTWKKFGVLPNTHAIVTFWEYENGVLDISVVNSSQIYQCRRDSAFFLGQLVQACKNMVGNYALSNDEELSLLLDEAALLADNGISHDTLLILEHVYELTKQPLNKNPQWFEFVPFVLLIILPLSVVAFIIYRRRSSLRRHKSEPIDLKKTLQYSSSFEHVGFHRCF
jgi:hypothetical protein